MRIEDGEAKQGEYRRKRNYNQGTHCMSKKSCHFFIVYSLCKNKQDGLDIQHCLLINDKEYIVLLNTKNITFRG